jgi:sulfate transport system ATP-binding protein
MIDISGLTKRFGDTLVLDRVDLHVPRGSLVALLGPSGSGKSTVLRIIAGLDVPDAGTLRLDGRDAADMSPGERRIGFVFQGYALFAHMTAAENVAFGLQVMRRPHRPKRAEIAAEVARLLSMVRLDGLANRLPAQLSGGQCQRVALARALAIRPRILLLDEPFGALDRAVRDELRAELRRLQAELGITTVMVTHDHEEAVLLANHIVTLDRGRIVSGDGTGNAPPMPAAPLPGVVPG